MISYQRRNHQPLSMVSSSIIPHAHNDLRIELENQEILLLDQGASGTTDKPLKGTIKLILDKPMNVRSITLLFYGKMKVSWIEGTSHNQHHYKQEKQLIEHKWQFVPHAAEAPKKVFTFPPGIHAFNFELQLPRSLPQSLEIEGGQITYRLKAIVERTVFQHKIVKKQDIQIVRCMLPSELELEQTLEIHNTWAECMRYDIQLPSKVYKCGSSVPISIRITPLASDLRVRYMSGTLKEFVTYSTDECCKEDTRIIRQLKIDDPFINTDEWIRDFQLELPELRSRRILCDADNDLIRIRHKIEFIIGLQNENGQLLELRCSAPAIVVCSTCQHAGGNTLPAYHQSSRSAFSTSTPIENNGLSSWNGIDLSRVPSYRTIASQQHIDMSLLSSLPDYDQLSTSSQTT